MEWVIKYCFENIKRLKHWYLCTRLTLGIHRHLDQSNWNFEVLRTKLLSRSFVEILVWKAICHTRIANIPVEFELDFSFLFIYLLCFIYLFFGMPCIFFFHFCHLDNILTGSDLSLSFVIELRLSPAPKICSTLIQRPWIFLSYKSYLMQYDVTYY